MTKARISPLAKKILNNPVARKQLFEAIHDRTKKIEIEGKVYVVKKNGN